MVPIFSNLDTDGFLTQWVFHRVQEHPKRSSLLSSLLILIFLQFTCSLFIFVFTIHFYVFTITYLLFIALYTMHYTLFTMYYALCIIYYALCTMHYLLCTMHYLLCTMHYALCTIYTYSYVFTILYVFIGIHYFT